MGHTIGELRQIREESVSVGTEASSEEAKEAAWVKSLIRHMRLKPALSTRDQALLAQYIWDMGHALAEVSRVLRSGGRAVYVVGDPRCAGHLSEILLLSPQLPLNMG
jgi:hypothetical protein